MIQKETWMYITDNTNIRWLKVFHLYKGFFRKISRESDFIKGSARIVEPPRLEYKGFKYRYNIKGDIERGLIVRTVKSIHHKDSSSTQFNNNSLIIIIKKFDFKSKYLNGPINKSYRRKKLKILFKAVV
jgi:ribosomal protein L14